VKLGAILGFRAVFRREQQIEGSVLRRWQAQLVPLLSADEKGSDHRFSVSQFWMPPSGIRIGAIGPSQRAKFDTNLGEEIGVAKWAVDAWIARCLDL
jgi:hypothetical protein